MSREEEIIKRLKAIRKELKRLENDYQEAYEELKQVIEEE